MGRALKALIIEDCPEVIESVSLILQIHWPEVILVPVESGERGIEVVQAEFPDVVILGIGLPDVNSFEVLRRIRAFSDVPVIILTGQATEELDKIKGFQLGADDYISQPFSLGVFIARVKNALAHTRISPNSVGASPFTIGNLTIDFAGHQAAVQGKPLNLAPIEYKLLCYLARNSGRLLHYEDILTVVWGEGCRRNSTDSLKVHIYRLRRKLAEAGTVLEMITSEWGGYRFVAPSELSGRGKDNDIEHHIVSTALVGG